VKKCPFCNLPVYIERGKAVGSEHLTFFKCGQRDDGADGCGAIVSFRPNLTGKKAIEAWDKRYTAPKVTGYSGGES
jgi:hypothetical protein